MSKGRFGYAFKFYVEESCISWHLDIGGIDPIVATIYEGLMSCHRHLVVKTMIETPYVGRMACKMLLDIAWVVCDKFWVSNENY